MLPSISHVLQKFLHKLRKGQFSAHRQVELQEVRLPEKTLQPAVAPIKKSLKETDAVPVVIQAVKEPNTEPHRALVRHRRPVQRYRQLDAMLEELKRERMTEMDTVMVPLPAHNLARQLHRSLEQEE